MDDDQGICSSMAMLLREEGYCVDETVDSGEAARLIKKDTYDVCLFDYKMRGLNGLDLLKMTKAIHPRCSVFIISGMLNIEELCSREVQAGLTAGVISKPFDVDALLKMIATVCSP